MEPQKYARQMQGEMIREIQGADPKYLVSVVMNGSWLQRIRSEQLIFTWANEYTAQDYAATQICEHYGSGNRLLLRRHPAVGRDFNDYILIYKRNR
jgi:hypothetical protein